MPKDPVCGKEVSKDSAFNESINNEKFYFCSKECFEEFEFNADDYLERQNEEIIMYAEE